MATNKPRVGAGMWASDAQRDRIFEMIASHPAPFHRERASRSKLVRHALILALLSASVAWAVAALTR